MFLITFDVIRGENNHLISVCRCFICSVQNVVHLIIPAKLLIMNRNYQSLLLHKYRYRKATVCKLRGSNMAMLWPEQRRLKSSDFHDYIVTTRTKVCTLALMEATKAAFQEPWSATIDKELWLHGELRTVWWSGVASQAWETYRPSRPAQQNDVGPHNILAYHPAQRARSCTIYQGFIVHLHYPPSNMRLMAAHDIKYM